MKRARLLAVAAAVALLAPSPPLSAGNPKNFPATHPLLRLLTTASLERGREHRALLVVPIAREEADPTASVRPLTSREAHVDKHLSVGEPDKKEGRSTVEVFNWSTREILLIAGETLEGGYRDRFLARDILLGPGCRALAPVIFADGKKRRRKDRRKSLTPVGALAPAYARYMVVFASLAAPVAKYLENASTITGDPNPRRSFAALLASAKLATRIEDYRTLFAKIPDEAGRRTVGMGAWVGDRLVGIDLFPTNGGFRAHWPEILRSLAFQAALYEKANGLLEQPFPAGRDPDRHQAEMKGLLRKPFAARVYTRDAIALGREQRLSRDGLVGRVLTHDDALVHAVLMRDLQSPLAVPPPGSTGPAPETTSEELIRRASRSRLTEYERRLLERILERRRNLGGENPPRPPRTPVRPPPPNDEGSLR